MNGVANATEVAVMFVADVEVTFAEVSVTTPVEVLTTVPVIVPLVEVRLPVPDEGKNCRRAAGDRRSGRDRYICCG